MFEESDLDPEELALDVDADDIIITEDGATVHSVTTQLDHAPPTPLPYYRW